MALDIFKLLNAIDNFDVNYYNNLPQDEKKEAYFFLIQRWMTGTNDSKQILYLNNFANNKVWSLHKEANLIYLLLCSCATGGKKRYTFPKRKKKENISETIKIIIQYYNCSYKNAQDYVKILSKDNILDICGALAVDKDVIAKIKKEIK